MPELRITALVLDESSEDLLHAVFQTLAYADVFDYPLSALEVHRYLSLPEATAEEVKRELCGSPFFSQTGEFFALRGREGIVETRRRRAEIAARLWPKAARYGRLIAALPFVRMVAVTGSLAMNNADEGKDVDFMIVTAPGYLWTCRLLSLLIARFAVLDCVHLCPNYLITTDALELRERSLYVAHELAQMVPLSGMEVYARLRSLNDWVHDFLPHASAAPELPRALKPVRKQTALQGFFESVLSLPFGRWLEKWEMKRKIERLTREQAHSLESYFSADVCKGHIDRHGEYLGTALAVRLAAFASPSGKGPG